MSRRFPTAFDERNKVVIAVIALALLIAGFFAAFYADSLPVIGGGKQRSAYFAESGGLKAGNEVRVAGVKVGKVSNVDLVGDKVVVTFRTKGVHLGDQTTAAIKVKTLLGQKYLALDPAGRADLGSAIPESRTTTPYDVAAAFSDLSTTVDEIDTASMEKSMDVLSEAFKNTPASVKKMVSGLTDLSRTISTRDGQLSELFQQTSKVTNSLSSRNTELGALIDDGDSLLTELQSRRDAVKKMLTGTAALGTQVRGLVADNEKQLAPALAKLDQVSAILQKNQDNLDKALADIGPYYRMLTNAMGNGRWVDSYLCGLFDATGAPVLENNVVRNCHPGGSK
ncbi:MCE family protein [Nocardioides sp.]|uniref:MCE family protein n=1 Tax=Nocardioides sp. TaxID=35761 RepID=UPI00260504B5|nr:MCE family protein [Nocardioides sp.]